MYQDEWVAGDTTTSGARSCAERWELISPEIPDHGVLLDVGSNLGYYSLRASEENPDLACVSLESGRQIAARQQHILRQNQQNRVCLIEGRLTGDSATEWAQTCDHFSAVLVLSVVHWFDDPEAVTAALCTLGGKVIVELNDRDDTGACGQASIALWADDPQAWLERVSGRSVRLIGRPGRHTSDAPSWLYVVEGPLERRPVLPYRAAKLNTFEHPEGRDYVLNFDGERPSLRIRDSEVDWVDGVNLRNLMQAGRLVWPPEKVWKRQARAALKQNVDHGDPGAHNILWGARGLTMIDGDDLIVRSVDGDEFVTRGIRRWSEGEVGGEYQRRRQSRAGELSLWMRRTEADGGFLGRAIRPVRRSLAGARRLLISMVPARRSG